LLNIDLRGMSYLNFTCLNFRDSALDSLDKPIFLCTVLGFSLLKVNGFFIVNLLIGVYTIDYGKGSVLLLQKVITFDLLIFTG